MINQVVVMKMKKSNKINKAKKIMFYNKKM